MGREEETRAALERIRTTELLDPRVRSEESLKRLVASGISLEERTTFTKREELLAARARQAGRAQQKQASNSEELPEVPRKVRALWAMKGLRSETEVITSKPDGNSIKLCCIRPDTSETLPCVMYIHGGGMATYSAFDPMYQVFGRVLAKQGVTVVLVDFRNCETKTASNPDLAAFPGGLNDCMSALQWVHANKGRLGVDERIVVAGESGGGNLTLALALKCKQEGRLDLVRHGFYAMCPYIAGHWPQDERDNGVLGSSHLNSENGGLMLTLPASGNAAVGYSLEAFKRRDPLAWPGFASVEQLEGLPRCVVTMNEMDPLRDEGILFCRKLLAAGVPAICKTVLATPHGGEINITALPHVTLDAVASIASFAKSRFVPDHVPRSSRL